MSPQTLFCARRACRAVVRAGLPVVIGFAAIAAQAQQSYDLRTLTLAIDFPAGPNEASAKTHFQDKFDNANPLAGGTYSGAIVGAGSYSTLANGIPAGAELNGAASDFFGTAYGLGRLRFNAADSTPNPGNLDAPGSTTVSTRITLNNPAVASLLNRSQSFEAATYWNFATPDSGSFYGIRASDGTTVGGVTAPYNDLIDLRVGRGNAGQAVVNLRRLSFDGVSQSISESFSQNVAAALFAGHTLAEVRLIELNLHYNLLGAGEPTVLRPTFNLLDGSGADIGRYEFAQTPTVFNGEDFTRVGAVVNWTVATVPEPAGAALWLGGLLVLGARLRRQRRRVAARR